MAVTNRFLTLMVRLSQQRTVERLLDTAPRQVAKPSEARGAGWDGFCVWAKKLAAR